MHKCSNYKIDTGWKCTDETCLCQCIYCKEFKRLDKLPEPTEEEIQAIVELSSETTFGPWLAANLPGFGAERFLITKTSCEETNWYPVVAELKNISFPGGEFMAWCRDGVPRLIKMIRKLQQEIDQLKQHKE